MGRTKCSLSRPNPAPFARSHNLSQRPDRKQETLSHTGGQHPNSRAHTVVGRHARRDVPKGRNACTAQPSRPAPQTAMSGYRSPIGGKNGDQAYSSRQQSLSLRTQKPGGLRMIRRDDSRPFSGGRPQASRRAEGSSAARGRGGDNGRVPLAGSAMGRRFSGETVPPRL